MVLPGDRHPPLLHRLQQRRLGARAGAVDLVRHQQLAEHRPRDEAERAPPGLALLQHLGAENIGRHQIRGALDALVVEAEDRAQCLDQPRLGEAGHADQQRVAAGQERDQGLLDHLALTENDLADALADEASRSPSASTSATRSRGGGVDGCGRVQAVRSLSTRARFGRNRDAGPDGKPAASNSSPTPHPRQPRPAEPAAFRSSCAISTCGSRATAPGIIAALRSTAPALVKLFASVLRRETDGSYWLVTPAERGRVVVEDAPFIAVALDVEGEGRDQRLIFRTNLDEIVTAGAGASAARRDRRRRHAGALYSGAAGTGGAAGAAGVLRAGRSRRRGDDRRRDAIRRVERWHVFRAGRSRR